MEKFEFNFIFIHFFYVRLQISHMFGYVDDYKLDFIVDNCGIMIAMLVPFVIKNEKCLQLIEEISDIVQKDLTSTIATSFLSIYTNLHLNETTDVSEKCIQFLMAKTDRSLNILLKSDIKVFHTLNSNRIK